jgi:hypothetical protein
MLRLYSGSTQTHSGFAQVHSLSAQVYSGSTQVRSPSAQVKAAAVHVQSLKWNQRKGKLILSPGVLPAETANSDKHLVAIRDTT